MLVWEKGTINKDLFRNIPNYLPANSMLVFNNTRVIHARLFFRKETGARIEVFCLEPVQPSDYNLAFQQTQSTVWRCLVGNSKRWKDEKLKLALNINGMPVELIAKKIIKESNSFLIEFTWNTGISFAELLEAAGILPIPPYLNRDSEPSDEETYQTIYAKNNGSVAAPTAGLHFTEDVMAGFPDKNITTREITLHVGAGTFTPVKSETIEGHTMHHETVKVSRQLIEELITGNRKIIAVGTTSVRSLESLYWLGKKINNGGNDSGELEVKQWEPYNTRKEISLVDALQNLLGYLQKNKLESLQFSSQIIIVPGYSFKLIEGMITNFHQPKSTLLLLISAFLGNDWKKVYDYALDNNFRFLSYGDSNLYLK